MLEKAEAVAQRCSVKKVFLEISQYLQENICAGVSSLIKLQACNFIKKETPAQECSCEFREISKNTFSYRKPPVAASEKGDSQIDRIWTVALFSKFYDKNLTVLLS